MRAGWVLACLTFFCFAASAAERWEMQYFYDQDKSSMAIADLKFTSAQRGIAVGSIVNKGNVKHVALVTGDGGKQWTTVALKEAPISIFFLDESMGWMVTDRGIWFTEESGRSWKKLHKQRGLERVYFLTREHGFAVGMQKTAIESTDGGATWKKLPAAEEPDATPELTEYNWISFDATGKTGVITGRTRSLARRMSRVPTWMDPKNELKRELPTQSLFLDTVDAGKSWRVTTASLFGTITHMSTAPDGRALTLFEFEDAFQYPSEVVRFDRKSMKYLRSFAAKQRLITDMSIVPDGPAFLAGVETPGELAHSPVPGPVKVLRSTDLLSWSPMDVDYRAVAHRVVMCVVDARNAWIATDTGMILKLSAQQ